MLIELSQSTASIPSSAGEALLQSRHFTSTRALTAQRDSSPIDYAFLPSLRTIEDPSTRDSLRVPLVPENFSPRRTGAHAPLLQDYDNVHRATIITAAADSTHVSAPSASEVHDNNAHHVDFHDVAEKLNQTAKSVSQGVEREAEVAGGFVKQLWGGLMDDVFGAKQRSRSTVGAAS